MERGAANDRYSHLEQRLDRIRDQAEEDGSQCREAIAALLGKINAIEGGAGKLEAELSRIQAAAKTNPIKYWSPFAGLGILAVFVLTERVGPIARDVAAMEERTTQNALALSGAVGGIREKQAAILKELEWHRQWLEAHEGAKAKHDGEIAQLRVRVESVTNGE